MARAQRQSISLAWLFLKGKLQHTKKHCFVKSHDGCVASEKGNVFGGPKKTTNAKYLCGGIGRGKILSTLPHPTGADIDRLESNWKARNEPFWKHVT